MVQVGFSIVTAPGWLPESIRSLGLEAGYYEASFLDQLGGYHNTYLEREKK